MPELGTIQPLSEQELLYRRLPMNPSYFDASARVVHELAFQPEWHDVDGLSVSRECLGPEGAAASGAMGRSFYVATLRVSDLVGKLGLTLVADRDDHAVITELTYERRRSKEDGVRDRLAHIYGQLVRSVLEVSGPFPGKTPPITTPRR